MFLSQLMKRNERLLEVVAKAHAAGQFRTNCYAIDLDTVEANARTMSTAASSLGLTLLAMTKQMGRNPDYCASIVRGGIHGAVAVDHECGVYAHRGGLEIGHIGHLVQIPQHEVREALTLKPKMWTVFSREQAQLVNEAAKARGVVQDIALRVWDERCIFYPGHAGGIHLSQVSAFAESLKDLSNVRITGVTSFPALLFDKDSRQLRLTGNASVIAEAASIVSKHAGQPAVVNMPGTTGTDALEMLAAAGATQAEPGHGLTGTTPLSVFEDTPEVPAVCYVTEVAHHHQGEAYVIGGGLYTDPVLGDVPTRALVISKDGDKEVFDVDMPAPGAIDYYARLQPNGKGGLPPVGSTVIFGFRAQVFVSRGLTAGITGISKGTPTVLPAYASSGSASPFPGGH